MNSGANKQFEPVCRFGPGGDFVSFWPEPSQLQSPSWELQCVFKDIGTKKHAHQLSAMFSPVGDGQVHKGCSFSVKQPMLFPDDGRIGPQAAYRPRLRTGARRRTTEKRLRVDVAEQNLLFTSNVIIAKTA
jgi:hypothetical protein